jgi:hypothetical protein
MTTMVAFADAVTLRLTSRLITLWVRESYIVNKSFTAEQQTPMLSTDGSFAKDFRKTYRFYAGVATPAKDREQPAG